MVVVAVGFLVIPAVAANVFKRIMLTAGWRLLIVNVADGAIVSAISYSSAAELKLTTGALLLQCVYFCMHKFAYVCYVYIIYTCAYTYNTYRYIHLQ